MAEFKNELILQDASGNSVSIDLRNALVLGSAPTTETKARAGMQAYVVSSGTITAEYVCTAVSGSTYTWVKREISGGGSGGVEIDATLTKSGKAADAAVVGEKLAEQSKEIADETTARENAIADLKAQGVQQTPLFAESVDWLNDNGDTTKLYVLPDWYIYTYICKKADDVVTPNFTNQLPISQELDSADPFNEVGYMMGVYLTSSATGYGSGSATDWVTGFIPYTIDKSIYLKGIAIGSASHDRVYLYVDKTTAPKTPIAGANVSNYFDIEQLENYYYKLTPISGSGLVDTTQYLRLSFSTGTPSQVIITVDEPIEYTTTEGGTVCSWQNTNRAFVPADYEDEIIENKTNITKLNERVSVLEAGGITDGVEAYVQEEAERVAKEVYSKQNTNTFTFLAISDMHYLTNNANIIASNIHAGQGMDLIRKSVNVDFAVCLGDNGWGSAVEGSENRATIEIGLAEIRGANKYIDTAFRGIPNFRTPGNHDNLVANYTWNGNDWLDGDELFPLYGAYNRGAVYPAGEKDRGYCYRDFEEWKLRVICMNSSDLKDVDPSGGAAAYMSSTQMKWFSEIVDLSSKSDAAEWSILILSHIPLDYSTSTQTVNILEAYVNGTSVSVTKDGVTITYDYSGKNAATIIGNVHGHNHCFLVDNLRKHVGGGVTEPIAVKRICIPNACYNRSNERGQNGIDDMYDIEYGETTTYNKVAGTAEDTAFNVVTIDPIARKIYATNYGAGYDREISY